MGGALIIVMCGAGRCSRAIRRGPRMCVVGTRSRASGVAHPKNANKRTKEAGISVNGFETSSAGRVSASLSPPASRLRICGRLGDLFRCLHHDLKWNFCQTPKIRMFVEFRLAEEWRAHSAAKAGDLSGRRQRLSLLLKQGCHLTKIKLRRLRLFCHANRPATGARTTAAMPAVPVEIFTKIMK